jgi:hypothetical protein
MRALFHRLRKAPAVAFDEATGAVCDAACRAAAAVDRVRTNALLLR